MLVLAHYSYEFRMSVIPGEPYTWLTGFVLSAILAAIAYRTKSVSKSGAIGGTALASIIYWGVGPFGLIVPIAFFVQGVLATRFKYQEKAAKKIAQEDEGKRGWKHALANVGAGVIAAVAVRYSGVPPLGMGLALEQMCWAAAFMGTFATAAADTVSSEIGMAIGKKPIHPITFRPVAPGTEGAVSLEGTLAGIVGAIVVCLFGAVGFGSWEQLSQLHTNNFYAPALAACAAIAGGLGNWLESLIGSTVGKNFNNELMNFLNTVIGGAIGWGLAFLWLSR